MDTPQTAGPHDGLAQATRARLFAPLGELKPPVLTGELAGGVARTIRTPSSA